MEQQAQGGEDGQHQVRVASGAGDALEQSAGQGRAGGRGLPAFLLWHLSIIVLAPAKDRRLGQYTDYIITSMRFGQRYASESISEWRDCHIDYPHLMLFILIVKDCVKEAQETG